MIRPLEGIKVLDLSRALAGPYCSMMLADMGADIIKIEMPGRGDDSRAWGPPFVEGESAYFMSVNRNKKSITLNLKNERAIEIIHKLIIQSDVLLENFRPGTMEKFKLSYEDVKEINPKIIYCSISGFGQDGPYRLLPGMDQILQGMGGLMSITGKPEGPPMKVGVAVADIAGGMFAAYGIMVALFNRERTKIGQRIDLSLLDCQIAWLTYRAGSYFVSGEIPKPLGSGHPVIVPYQAFKAKDEYFNVAVGNDQLWEKFCRAIGLGKIKDDPKFSTNAMRVKNREKLINIIEKAVGSKKADKWLKLLTAEGVPCGPILNTEQIFRDPQVIHREMVKEITHQKAGKIKVTGVPIKFSETPGEVLTAPPT
ncbi:MAG: CaiB/BaiF CoA transferase family protein, partial [Promethearchaeota archaeon]